MAENHAIIGGNRVGATGDDDLYFMLSIASGTPTPASGQSFRVVVTLEVD